MIEPLLSGQRVLVVEDDLLVSMLIEDILADQGCAVIGPFTTLAQALQAARSVELDLALLDVNLRGERVYPVAEVLAQRHIPFLLVSGYGEDAVPAAHPDWRAVTKPFHARDLVKALANRLARAGA
jgi:DNA-binding response OmpR family regulator